MFKQAQIEAQDFIISAYTEAANEATKLQEFFSPSQAKTLSQQMIQESIRMIRGKKPDAMETASFKTSSPDELETLREQIKTHVLNDLMTAFAEIYTTLQTNQGGQA